MNQWGLGAPWDDAYLEPQQKRKIFFDVYKYMSNNPPKSFQGLAQWALVPLGPTIIYNPKKRNNIL